MTDPVGGGRPVRVLLLIKCLSMGGAERLIVSLCEARDKSGFDYEVAYVLSALDGLVPEVEATGVPVYDLGCRGQFDLRWIVRLRRLLQEHHYDVVHLHLPYVTGIGRAVVRSLPRHTRPKIVSTHHNLWPYMPAAMRVLNRATFSFGDADLAVSSAVRESLPAAMQPRVEVVVHGVLLDEPEAYATAREEVRAELGIGPGEVLAITVAMLRKEKGYDVLLSAISTLAAEGLPVRFAAVGYGPMDDTIRALHAELGLGDRLLFLGLRSDALRLVAGSDVFVLASSHEGFPVAVMEALALGVPVVATAVGAIPQALTDDVNGLIVPPGRPDLLAAAIRSLVIDPAHRSRLAEEARRTGQRYDIRLAVGRIESLYRQLADR